jgi:pimeloyl-[acyl-carrier protein] methyl ester esterase
MKSLPVIAIGGWATTADCWTPVKTLWKKRPEAADTAWLSASWSDLIAQQDNLFSPEADADQKYLLVGWSLGGLLALRAAAENPDQVAGLVLVSSTAKMTADDDYPGANLRAIRAMRLRASKNPNRVLQNFASTAMAPERIDHFPETYLEWANSFSPEKLQDGLAYLAETDLRDSLNRIDFPVRIVHGTEDQIVPHESAEYLANRLAGSKLRSIDGAGHLLPLTAATAIVEEMASVPI